MDKDEDQATHASGKRNVDKASSDAHRMSHARDKTLRDADADPQKLDTREAEAKRRAFGRKPAEG